MQDFLIDRPSTRPRRDPEYAWSQRGWPIEFPGTIEDGPQVYCYTDKYSYAHGETIQIHACPFHKLELYEIGELPATGMLWSSSCRTF